MSKVSVLTAVYNDEKHLRKCLDSLCNQTLKDIQIICIDDGSTDSTPEILNEYSSLDSRIVVIRQEENKGQAIARNAGLEVSDGKYITMLDSDDWFGSDALEEAYNALEKNDDCDCALFKLMMCYPQGSEEDLKIEEYPNQTSSKKLKGKDAFYLSLDFSLHGLYMVRSELHKIYPYDTSCQLYSDDNTSRLHYLHSRNVVLCDGKYFYLKHSESMTKKPSLLRFDLMFANLNMKRLIEEERHEGMLGDLKESEKILDFYETHRWLMVVDSYYFYYLNKKSFTRKERKVIKDKFREIIKTIESHRLSWHLRIKLGYVPFKHWWLFKTEEQIYFKLKEWLT
jgi:glycosyltransferase involved in cell wall biosynthesis